MSKIFLREMLISSQNLSRRFIDGEIVNILEDEYEKFVELLVPKEG